MFFIVVFPDSGIDGRGRYNTEIKIYGCHLRPFFLPVFLTPRMFSLEYVRQILSSNEIHFVSNKHKATFKLKKDVGPFIINVRSTL
jgi:hypothetical protein